MFDQFCFTNFNQIPIFFWKLFINFFTFQIKFSIAQNILVCVLLIPIYIYQKLLIAIYSLCICFYEINNKNSLVLTSIKFSFGIAAIKKDSRTHKEQQNWKLEKWQQGNEKTKKNWRTNKLKTTKQMRLKARKYAGTSIK